MITILKITPLPTSTLEEDHDDNGNGEQQQLKGHNNIEQWQTYMRI
jgi:hypothetical protein